MIICCGEALIDMLPSETANSEQGCFKICPGGSIYNVSIAAARLGLQTSFLGRISSDFLGDKLFSRLADNGVGTELIVRSEEPVTLAFVERNAKGEAKYAFYANGAADRSFLNTDIPKLLPAKAKFLIVGSISLVLEPAASTIQALIERESKNLIISYDPNVRPSLINDKSNFIKKFENICSYASIVKLSYDDLCYIYGKQDIELSAKKIMNLGPKLVIISLGEDGSFALGVKAKARELAAKVKVADTIGAGDTFHAAVITALSKINCTKAELLDKLDAESLSYILKFASAAAAINCTRNGAEPPTLQELMTAYPECCQKWS